MASVGEVWLTPREISCIVRRRRRREKRSTARRLRTPRLPGSRGGALRYDDFRRGERGHQRFAIMAEHNVKNSISACFPRATHTKAMQEYNKAELITKVLYPTDDHYQGKTLRLKQQYFLVAPRSRRLSATISAYYGDVRTLPARAIHINDTHPALCVPELIRILIDDHQLDLTRPGTSRRKVIAYTNHR